MAKIIVPCDLEITRYYRGYVKVDEDATSEEVKAAMRQKILEDQDECMSLDPDLAIEEDDIKHIHADFVASWTDEEDEAIREVLGEFTPIDDAALIKLWQDFGDIPINDRDEIEEPFLFFECGTDRFDIWHWFDEKYPGGVIQLMKDSMKG